MRSMRALLGSRGIVLHEQCKLSTARRPCGISFAHRRPVRRSSTEGSGAVLAHDSIPVLAGPAVPCLYRQRSTYGLQTRLIATAATCVMLTALSLLFRGDESARCGPGVRRALCLHRARQRRGLGCIPSHGNAGGYPCATSRYVGPSSRRIAAITDA